VSAQVCERRKVCVLVAPTAPFPEEHNSTSTELVANIEYTSLSALADLIDSTDVQASVKHSPNMRLLTYGQP
jgi:hypothetical protein